MSASSRRRSGHKQNGKLMGSSTFGKTHFNRLRKTDILMLKLFPYLFCPLTIHNARSSKKQKAAHKHDSVSCFVDIGFGDEPITLLQSINYIHAINPNVVGIGCEIDNHKVMNAVKSLTDNPSFYESVFPSLNLQNVQIYKAGFELHFLRSHKQYKLKYIRCMNVLRQFYDESDIQRIHKSLCSHLDINGVLLEGTSDKFGRFWCVNVLNASAKCIAVVFGTNFKSRHLNGFHPKHWQSVLPKNLIHRVNSEHSDDRIISQFFDEWKSHYNLAMTTFTKTGNHKQHFVDTIVSFSSHSTQFHIAGNVSWIKKGFVVWKIEGYGLPTSVIYGTHFPPRKNKVRC